MKTTDATVLDEPKTHVRATEETIEPAIESQPRPTTGRQGSEDLHRREILFGSKRKGFGVRSRFALRRWNFRGHTFL
jgi:hypothetical protein